MNTLDVITLKLERAKELLIALEEIEKPLINKHPHIPTGQFEANGMEYVYRLGPVPSVPTGFFIPMGECLYHLRTILDYFALAMNVKGLGQLTEDMAKGSQFPICESRRDFNKAAGRIGWIDYLAARAIEDLQPYVGGNDPPHALTMLNYLANVDKHRYPPVTVTVPTSWAVSADPNAPRFRRASTPPLKAGAEIGRYVFDIPQTKVPVTPYFFLNIACQEEGPVRGHGVIFVLKFIRRFMEDSVIPTLSPFV